MAEANDLAGYTLDRDEQGLTARQREVLDGIAKGKGVSMISREIGLSRQRVHQIVSDLVNNGVLRREGRKLVRNG